MEIDSYCLTEASADKIANAETTLDLEQLPEPVHFIGIGGIGMSALARLLIRHGKKVSGSDKCGGAIIDELVGMGARIFIGHKASNAVDAGSVVVSTAIVKDNPELEYARGANLPVWHRSDILSALTARSRLIAVTGTHGKTTTTGMVAQVLIEGGVDPSVVVGGIFETIGSNARFGEGDYFVAEADESDGTHATLASAVALITNIEADHLENYPGGMTQIREAMISFANRAQSFVLICSDDPGCMLIKSWIDKPVITYGLKGVSEADYSFENLNGFSMKVFRRGSEVGGLELKVPGVHNKLNALAAVAVGLELGIAFEEIKHALENFGGICRRFQILGEERGILVVDDYAHHPTEVVATLKAAKDFLKQRQGAGQRVVAVFQPHQPGRLRDLWNEFLLSFADADLALIADIYVARGGAIEGITSERFVAAMKHDNVHYLPGSVNDLPQAIAPYLKAGDLVLTIGAGDITSVGNALLEHLRNNNF
ncbi:MAG TPA: UDP-N-acetylmuramate--L-alanine ligase [Candidatus Obscuribacterales bacterium]